MGWWIFCPNYLAKLFNVVKYGSISIWIFVTGFFLQQAKHLENSSLFLISVQAFTYKFLFYCEGKLEIKWIHKTTKCRKRFILDRKKYCNISWWEFHLKYCTKHTEIYFCLTKWSIIFLESAALETRALSSEFWDAASPWELPFPC